MKTASSNQCVLCRALQRLANRLRQSMGRVEEIHQIQLITGNNNRILCFLNSRGEDDVFQKDLETEFGLTRSAASKILTQLEEKNLVRRMNVEQDARLRKLVLTREGQELCVKLHCGTDALDRQLLKGFSLREKDQLFEYLHRINQNLDQLS